MQLADKNNNSDILENKELIANLDNTKNKTNEIKKALDESKGLTEVIEKQRGL